MTPSPAIRARVVWGVFAALLVVVPAATNAARQREFPASFHVLVVEHPVFYLPEGRAGYVRLLLRDRELGRQTVKLSGLPIDDASVKSRIDVRGAERDVIVTARADTPARARDLAAALRLALERTSPAAFRAEAAARRRAIRSRLESHRTTPAERRRLVARRRAMPGFFGVRKTRVVLGPPPSRPEVTEPLDRAVDALPGRFPPAASPLAVGAAGLAAALALLVLGGGLARRAARPVLRRRPLGAEGPRRPRSRNARRPSPP